MTDRYKVFHNPCEALREKLHIILVRPEHGGNIGSAARALKNMGIMGRLIIVGNSNILNTDTVKMARHAYDKIEKSEFVSTLEIAIKQLPSKTRLLASTARVGSSTRPHPTTLRQIIPREIEKLKTEEIPGLAFVFGPESDGLSNEEASLCDALVTIPSSPEYRSINLSQSVLIFSYEANEELNRSETFNPSAQGDENKAPGQRMRLIQNLLSLAEEVGFVLPGDPHKMRTRLEEIFSTLPKHIPEARTLHGFLDQVRRSFRKGKPDIKGRYLWKEKQRKEMTHAN